ncbi:MAG: hypothetical protein OHK93_002124 [Ramalina farinacea]|uniref:Uncharacterized protein n=1 Tax=Ramalina farinacea TaxID=258253 RepID=A0AA43TWX1_9LECA|nr:hypothetical protein [Ramalina farinacea]
MGKSSGYADPSKSTYSSSRDTSKSTNYTKSSSGSKSSGGSSKSDAKYGKPEVHHSAGQSEADYTRADGRYFKGSSLSEGYGGKR